MPLEISRNDIRNIKADAIVDPTDEILSGSGGTDFVIHEMAGEELDVFLEGKKLKPGEAIITGSYDCKNCSHIIHTCGPLYEEGNEDAEKALASCYRNSLELARDNGLGSIAFPLIASGTFMFPKGKALRIATDTITEFLDGNEMNVYLLVYDKDAFDTASKLYSDIRDYLDKNYVERKHHVRPSPQSDYSVQHSIKLESRKTAYHDDAEITYDQIKPEYIQADESYTFEPDESFSECMIRMIDEKGMEDPDVYKRANIDRKHFNHIKNTKNYKPKKITAVALAIGMRLDLNETNALLEKAGFVLSRSSKFDLIIKYCLENNIYDIFEINEILFANDQKIMV